MQWPYLASEAFDTMQRCSCRCQTKFEITRPSLQFDTDWPRAVWRFPLLRVERTWLGRSPRSEFDPYATSIILRRRRRRRLTIDIQMQRRQLIDLVSGSRMCQGALMSWQHVRISRFGGPEVLELAEEPTIPNPGAGEVRIKVLAAGTGFTDSFIRRGRYPDF